MQAFIPAALVSLALASCLPWGLPELEPASERAGVASPRSLEVGPRPQFAGRASIWIGQAAPDAHAAPGAAAGPGPRGSEPPPVALMSGTALWLFPERPPSVSDPDDIARRFAAEGASLGISPVAQEVGVERGDDVPGLDPPQRRTPLNPMIVEEPSTGAPILVIPQGGRRGILAVPLDGTPP
ncbi:MAG: hypothetical protein GVY13_09670 [Alphaproteobacteria bacterium]|jgi:hypothetical protein|nr:hypothetical protein [Alphaproteobacteria bacterium]